MYKTILLLCVLYTSLFAGKWEISGVVKTAAGTPPDIAHVHVSSIQRGSRTVYHTAQTDNRGAYHISLAHPGWYTLRFTAPYHQETPIVIHLSSEDSLLTVNITLPSIRYNEPPEEVKIIGDWNNFSFAKAETMTKRADGTFEFTVKARGDTLAYQILDNVERHSFNGTQQDYFVYDGGGDYRSVLRTKPGEEVRIVFDPKKFGDFGNDELPRVEFDAAHEVLGKINELYRLFERSHQAYLKEVLAYQEKHFNLEGFQYDFSGIKAQLGEYLKSDNNLLQRFVAILLLNVELKNRPPDKTQLKKLWEMLPPDDLLWELSPFAISMVPSVLFPQHADSVLEKFYELNPTRLVKAIALARLTAKLKQQNKEEAFVEHYRKLKSEFSDLLEVQYELKKFDPERRIAVGKPVPDFEVKLIGSEKTVTRKSMLGKYYLIDFWAVWCMPCVAEIPNLQQVYQQFKDKNFEILSISLDADDKIVQTFWEKKYKMPWLNAR
ncbi:MAG: hypothetical protein D6748_06440, partial [Calditrichaeota bacterium]